MRDCESTMTNKNLSWKNCKDGVSFILGEKDTMRNRHISVWKDSELILIRSVSFAYQTYEWKCGRGSQDVCFWSRKEEKEIRTEDLNMRVMSQEFRWDWVRLKKKKVKDEYFSPMSSQLYMSSCFTQSSPIFMGSSGHLPQSQQSERSVLDFPS